MRTGQSGVAAFVGHWSGVTLETTGLRRSAVAAVVMLAAVRLASAQLPVDQYDTFFPSDLSLTDQEYGYYGYTMVDGDFNCDGLDDLATGNPYWNATGSTADSGLVMIQYATATGFAMGTSEWLHQNIGAIPGTPEAGDHFGGSVASGDFNGDGCDDLAIGIPYEDVGTIADAGAVTVVYGSATGIDDATAVMFHQDIDGVEGTAQADEQFGFSVAAGDFDGDGVDDLAIGVPWSPSLGTLDVGAVHVFRGTATGLTTTGQQYISPGDSTNGLPARNAGERFGWALAFGDVYTQRVGQELVIGHPYRDVSGLNAAGMVSVVFGDELATPASLSFTQDSLDIGGALEANDHFGLSLAIGDFDADGYADVAASAPGEDVDTFLIEDAGMVIVMSLGPSPNSSRSWLRSDLVSLSEADYTNDEFGRTLLSGDFDDDGFADLAIAAPLSSSYILEEGSQFVLYGKAGTLLSDDRAQELRDCHPGCSQHNQKGRALASGQFDEYPGSDLAVSLPGMPQAALDNVGIVKVRYADNLFRGAFETNYRDLARGNTLYGLAAVDEQDRYYRFYVPPGQLSLGIETSGGSGDLDLYVRHGSLPGTSSGSYDCRGVSITNDETCTFSSPQGGYWYVLVHAYSNYSGARLFANYSSPFVGP